jgi:DNA-directed RNA polymerase subunit RPC12/RpoP
MFGSKNVESQPIECPKCPRGLQMGANDWEDAPVDECYPGQKFKCKRCGTEVTINWGLVEPDHLSTWVNSEYCPHRMCKVLYERLYAA